MLASHALVALLLLAPIEPPPIDSSALLVRAQLAADVGDRVGTLSLLGKVLALRLPQLRNLPFLRTIEPKPATRSELRSDVIRGLRKPEEQAALRLMDRSLKAFGVVAPVVDTRRLVTNLLSEEVAGFYDAEAKRLRVVAEPGDAIDVEKTRGVLAHELAHALADQHFDLEAMHRRVRGDEDMHLATTALIEGEAMLVMIADGRERDGVPDPTAIFAVPAGLVDALFTVLGRFAPELSGAGLRLAPPFFARTMLFPYHEGMVFLLRVGAEDHWAAVDAVFRSPPLSTEQILHPEKYPSDVPRDFALPDLSRTLGRSLRRVGTDVLGEAQLAALLHDDGAAAGWDGDRYVVYEDQAGRLALVWASIWDTEADARELVRAYVRYSDERARRNHALAEVPHFASDGETQRRTVSGRATLLRRTGDRVLVLEGFAPELTERLLVELADVPVFDKRLP